MNTLFDLSRPTVDPSLVDEKLMAVDFGARGGFVYVRDGKLETLAMPHLGGINDLFRQIRPTTLVGENVHAFPGQGVVSVASFMEGKGQIVGLACAWKCKVELIQPEEWVTWYGIGKRSDFKVPGSDKNSPTLWKRHLQAHAKKLFPDLDIPLEVADAVLIWNYAVNPERIRKPKPPRFK